MKEREKGRKIKSEFELHLSDPLPKLSSFAENEEYGSMYKF